MFLFLQSNSFIIIIFFLQPHSKTLKWNMIFSALKTIREFDHDLAWKGIDNTCRPKCNLWELIQSAVFLIHRQYEKGPPHYPNRSNNMLHVLITLYVHTSFCCSTQCPLPSPAYNHHKVPQNSIPPHIKLVNIPKSESPWPPNPPCGSTST